MRLPDSDGVALCRELRSQVPRTAYLMLTSFTDDQVPLDAVLAGASGYVVKDVLMPDGAGVQGPRAHR